MQAASAGPSIVLAIVNSSQIHSIGYDAASGTLAIRFKDRDTGAPTSLYHYANFSPDAFEAFRNAASLGSFFFKHIKPFSDVFPYVRIEKMPQASDAPGDAR